MQPIRFFSFWAINAAPLDASALNRQLAQLRDLGLDGVIFHPRRYPGDPPYLSQAYMDIVSQVILRAKELGMAFVLYDDYDELLTIPKKCNIH